MGQLVIWQSNEGSLGPYLLPFLLLGLSGWEFTPPTWDPFYSWCHLPSQTIKCRWFLYHVMFVIQNKQTSFFPFPVSTHVDFVYKLADLQKSVQLCLLLQPVNIYWWGAVSCLLMPSTLQLPTTPSAGHLYRPMEMMRCSVCRKMGWWTRSWLERGTWGTAAATKLSSLPVAGWAFCHRCLTCWTWLHWMTKWRREDLGQWSVINNKIFNIFTLCLVICLTIFLLHSYQDREYPSLSWVKW